MSPLQAIVMPRALSPLSFINTESSWLCYSPISFKTPSSCPTIVSTYCHWDNAASSSIHMRRIQKPLTCFAVSRNSDPDHKPQSVSKSKAKPKTKSHSPEAKDSKPKTKSHSPKAKDSKKEDENSGSTLPFMIPRKPRRGCRSEAVAIEDFVRGSLERTFASIKEQNPELFENAGNIIKERVDDSINFESRSDDDDNDCEDEDEDDEDEDLDRRKGKKKKMVVREEDPDWPLDADVGWGIRASEYFEQHPIKNVVGEDGFEIDWEGELDDSWLKEINCLEWESFAFHPSPLVVFVFERYNRASDNWKTLKELEKAAKVYWSAKDRLPPRMVKLDINIERDLAYALKAKECPQILFLRGQRILYREKEFRTADELVQMIAHFYYNAKRPSCMNNAAPSSPQ